MVSLDLDDFKLVNDSLGHPTADSLLVHAGKRVADCVRPGDTVARIGGDEFSLLLESEVDDSHLVAQRVIEAFNKPFVVDGQNILMRPSIGVAVAPADEPELAPETLIKRADIAMFAAKRSRSSRVHTFNADMVIADPDAMRLADHDTDRVPGDGAAQVRLLGELRRAIDAGRFTVLYQPKFDLRTGHVVGVEALLRWPHPELGVLRPDAFMSLVRQHGLMRPVTDLVLEKVVDDAARWAVRGAHVPVAVNLFAPFLRDTRLPDTLCRALERGGLPAELLTVAITEDLVLNEIGLVTEVLKRLRTIGIRVAIDDFGSGYSALSYLRDLTIDEIKLDRNFIGSVTSNIRAASVVRAVIELAHDLQITLVAEGIEDAATATWLRDQGCDIGQGYHFGKPIDAAGVPDLVGVAVQSACLSRGQTDYVDIMLVVVVLLESAGLVALGVLLIVSRRRLAGARKELRRQRAGIGGRPRPRQRSPLGVAPLAVKTVVHTLQGADSLIRKGIVGSVRSSVEDLAGWARVERPDLASITSDGRVVLVFSDIEGSTERNELLGDRAWVEILERHNGLIERRVTDHRGYVVKNQGDGFMIAFASPDDAVRCSVSVQQALREDPERYDGIRVRIGAHAGSSVRRGDDLFGRDVVLAARIADLAGGGEILVSHELRESIADPDGIAFDAPLEVELKGLRGMQTVYPVNVPAAR